jgi:hypothetical protein
MKLTVQEVRELNSIGSAHQRLERNVRGLQPRQSVNAAKSLSFGCKPHRHVTAVRSAYLIQLCEPSIVVRSLQRLNRMGCRQLIFQRPKSKAQVVHRAGVDGKSVLFHFSSLKYCFEAATLAATAELAELLRK